MKKKEIIDKWMNEYSNKTKNSYLEINKQIDK